MHSLRLALLSTLAAAAAGQAPDGWLAVSAQSTTSDGGIYLLRPRDVGQPPISPTWSLWVSGLPGELVGLNDGQARGANCVAIERDTGLLLVGEAGPAGTSIDLHRLQVTVAAGNATGAVLSKTLLGVSTSFVGGVTDMELLPDGDVVLAVVDLVSQPPLNGNRLARFSPSTGALTPIVTNAPAGSIESIAADPTGSDIYFHVRPPGSPTQGDLFRCPVGGGSVTQVRMIAHFRCMTVDAVGHLHAVGSTFSFELDPATGNTLAVDLFNLRTRSVAIERATQTPLYLIADQLVAGVFVDGPSSSIRGHVPLLATGIAVQDSPQTYGTGTPGAVAYAWGRPPAASLPLPGNSAFAIQVDASDSAPHLGLLVASPLRASVPILGVQALVDPVAAGVVAVLSSGTPLPLPLPAQVPPGARLFFQCAFPDSALPGGIATSDGLLVGVIR